MKIYIAADHGGFELKNRILKELQKEFDMEDLGPFEFIADDDYPDFALKVATAVAENGMNDDLIHKTLGILICKSGNGMCIAANKVKGAYASLCFSKIHAEMARKHDNANIICLDSEYEGEDPVEIVKKFLKANFDGIETRHGRRFKKILDIENRSNFI